MGADGGFAIDGEKFAIAPHGLWATFDDCASEYGSNGIVVVGGFEGAEVEVADMNGLLWISSAAFAAFEIDEEGRCFVHKS